MKSNKSFKGYLLICLVIVVYNLLLLLVNLVWYKLLNSYFDTSNIFSVLLYFIPTFVVIFVIGWLGYSGKLTKVVDCFFRKEKEEELNSVKEECILMIDNLISELKKQVKDNTEKENTDER